MARTMRDRLTTAAAQLEAAGHPDSAAAVTAVLAPGGWTLLREADAPFTTNLPMTMRKSLRDALKKAAEQRNLTLTAVVTEGHQRMLEGSWTPPKPGKAARGSYTPDDSRVVLNVTVEDSLRVRLRTERIPVLSEELGYKVTEGGSAIAYLKHKFRAELATLLPETKTTAE